MTTQVRSKLIASGNIKPAVHAAPQTVKGDLNAIHARYMELNRKRVQSAMAILKAASLSNTSEK